MRAPETAAAADGADSLVFAHAVPREPVMLRATTQPGPANQGTSGGLSRVASYLVALTMRFSDAGCADIQRSRLYSNHRSPLWSTEDTAPRSLEPIVRRRLEHRTELINAHQTRRHHHAPHPHWLLRGHRGDRGRLLTQVLFQAATRYLRSLNQSGAHAQDV